jgi:RNA polymerase sigma-70 factor (ECF subfamily)
MPPIAPEMGKAPEQLSTADAPGTAPALEVVYAEGFDHVWYTLRRLGVRERDLEDKAHDVFLVVHRRLADFEPSRQVKPWLTGICYRVASDYRRSARYRRETVWEDMSLIPGGDTPEDAAQQSEARDLVLLGLEALPMEQRVVFVMHDIQQFAVPEIARELDVPHNTLYSRLRLARKKFTLAVRAASEGDREQT